MHLADDVSITYEEYQSFEALKDDSKCVKAYMGKMWTSDEMANRLHRPTTAKDDSLTGVLGPRQPWTPEKEMLLQERNAIAGCPSKDEDSSWVSSIESTALTWQGVTMEHCYELGGVGG
ncbi:hypothetical protein QAD02_008277 [Eretmocerus hayati]|uniref:Uncharacterized protein n=1 Tax=Eretmocerus hayati TaxID=131215 RepID=A0ACC2NAE0_9HYME|nr:hypothetical protein QAD02_008277 [Eretmocerus hayati]